MFSFHKPRVYRSGNGCCICRAKSSSSRFTDSKRYEQDFLNCFRLEEVRSGEICNACVLLVKRWKKLPRGSERHWQHVVDARAGHGSKPLSKINKKKHSDAKLSREGSPDFSQEQLDCLSNGSGSYTSTMTSSPGGNDDDDDGDFPPRSHRHRRPVKQIRKGRTKGKPRKFAIGSCTFVDSNFWTREKTCCGIIFKGISGEVILDRRYMNPCFCRMSATSSPSLSPTQEDQSVPISSLRNGIKVTDDAHTPPQDIDTMRMLASTATSLALSSNLHSAGSLLTGFPGHDGHLD